MSGSVWEEIKRPFYQIAAQDSRNLKQSFNRVGFDWGEKEADKNIDNPGRAIGKAATSAALWWLGANGAEAAAPAAGAAAGAGAAGSAAGTAALTAAEIAAEQAAQIAAEEAAKQALSQGGQGILQTGAQETASQGLLQGSVNTVPVANTTMEAGLMDTGYTPSSFWNALNNPKASAVSAANRGLGTSMSQTGLLSSGSGTGKGGMLATQMGMKMMAPEQQPPPQAPPPRQQASPEPLATPYGNGLLTHEQMTEEQKRMLRARGLIR